MATNNIKIFDENKGNMMSTQEYSTNAQRLNGVQQGIASSMLQNKTLYQLSLVAYAIGQMMVNNGLDANDENAVSTFVGNLSNTIVQKIVDKASTSEAQAGTDANKFMTPATTLAAINVLKATSEMATAGTDTTHWMTPALVKQMIGNLTISEEILRLWISSVATAEVGEDFNINRSGTMSGYLGFRDGVKGLSVATMTFSFSSLASDEKVYCGKDINLYNSYSISGGGVKTGNIIITAKINNIMVYTKTIEASRTYINDAINDFVDELQTTNFNVLFGKIISNNDVLSITVDISSATFTSTDNVSFSNTNLGSTFLKLKFD